MYVHMHVETLLIFTHHNAELSAKTPGTKHSYLYAP